MVERKPVKTRNKGGHPGEQGLKENREKCWKCFNEGLSILKAAEQTNLNKETVCNYYKVFKDELIARLDNDFIIEQKTARQFAMKKLEDRIEEVRIIQNDAYGKKNAKSNEWHNTALKCIEVIASLEQTRYALEMSPTVDVDIEGMIKQSRDIVANIKSGNKQPKEE